MDVLFLLLLIAALVMVGVSIGFTLIAACLVLIAVQGLAPVVIPLRLFNGVNSFAMVAVPLFILAGCVMNVSGLSTRLVDFASSLIGWLRGGLAMTTTLTSMFFAEVSGSAVAGAAALGSVLLPAMKEKGYPAHVAAAVLSSSSTIAIVLPPSIPMIIYASITGASVARLFLAGFIPGVLVGLSIMIMSAVLARVYGFAEREAFSLARVRTTFASAFWTLTLPVVVLGGIFTGFYTATEAAAVAVIIALIIGGLQRSLRPGALPGIFLETAHQTGVVMILVAASAVLGWYLSNQQIPDNLARFVLAHVQGQTATLLLMNAALLIAGMFLHSTAAIVLLVPIFMPLAAQIGLDPVHFGLIVTLNLAIGQQTPPVASVLITACSLARAPLAEVMRVNIFFIVAMVVVLAFVTFVPAMSLWLPDMVLGSE